MKKYLFLILVFASANAFAQEKWTIGFDLGGNATGNHVYNLSPHVTSGYKTGLFWGGELAYSPDDKFTFRAQCFLYKRSVSFSSSRMDSFYVQGQYVIQENTQSWYDGNEYFEIPLTVKYAVIGERSQGYVFTGPVFSIASEGSGGLANFALTGGIGFSHAFHMFSFFVEGAYTFGLKNIASDHWNRISDEPYYSEFSRDFRINTGLLFNID